MPPLFAYSNQRTKRGFLNCRRCSTWLLASCCNFTFLHFHFTDGRSFRQFLIYVYFLSCSWLISVFGVHMHKQQLHLSARLSSSNENATSSLKTSTMTAGALHSFSCNFPILFVFFCWVFAFGVTNTNTIICQLRLRDTHSRTSIYEVSALTQIHTH